MLSLVFIVKAVTIVLQMLDRVRSGNGDIWLLVDSERMPRSDVLESDESERCVEARDSSFDKIWKPLKIRKVVFSLSPTGNKEERF